MCEQTNFDRLISIYSIYLVTAATKNAFVMLLFSDKKQASN